MCRLSRCTPDLSMVGRRRCLQPPCRISKVEAGAAASQRKDCHVMGPSRHLSRRIRPEPNPGLRARLPDLTHPLTVVPSPDTSVNWVSCLPEDNPTCTPKTRAVNLKNRVYRKSIMSAKPYNLPARLLGRLVARSTSSSE